MKKILVIEDELHISKLVKYILEKNGFNVLQASIGKDGIDLAKREKPNLIVLDVMMPNMDGYEVARTLSASNEINGIPIIMLSSAAQFKDRVRGFECGAVDYITKPFNKDDLIAKVNRHIK